MNRFLLKARYLKPLCVRYPVVLLRTGSAQFSTSTNLLKHASPNSDSHARKALFYVPGSEERKLNSSLKLKDLCDCFCYDIEDGVAMNRKDDARKLIYNALETFDVGSSEKAVRINAVGSGLEKLDLEAVLPSKYLQAILVPKVQTAEDVLYVTRMIDSIAPTENRQNIKIIAGIESGLGIMNLKEIANSDPRVDALLFASEDYCADVGLIRTPSRKEMQYARQAVVTAAAAYGLQAIDIVCVDYKSEDILHEECIEGRQFGFTGKQAIHPSQVAHIQKHFMPSEKDIEYATRIIDGYKNSTASGIGAFNLDGKMIDMPVVKWAERILARANL